MDLAPADATAPTDVADVADVAEELVDALVVCAFTITAVLSRIAAEHDISLTQFRVLAILRDRRLRMTALSQYLGLERSTLSGLIDRGEARGLLARAPHDGDRRSVDVLLTAAGAALAQRGAAEVHQALAPLTGRLSAQDARRLRALLARMLSSGGVGELADPVTAP